MKTYLIDGYNLVRSGGFDLPEFDDLESEREYLISRLKEFLIYSADKILVVFDNQEMPPSRRKVSPRLEVVFPPPGVDADTYIRNFIRKQAHRQELVLVSSDTAIQLTARGHGVPCMTSYYFFQMLEDFRHQPGEEKETENPEKFDGELSDREVDEWLNLFRQDEDDES